MLTRLLTALFGDCPHGGALTPLRTLCPGVEVWLCHECAREVVYTDA